MSEKVFISHLDDHNQFEVRLGGAAIRITELRVQPMSNWKTPHQVLGKGGASIALTDEQFLQLVSEYLRYTLCHSEDTEAAYSAHSVGFDFSCEISRGEIALEQSDGTVRKR